MVFCVCVLFAQMYPGGAASYLRHSGHAARRVRSSCGLRADPRAAQRAPHSAQQPAAVLAPPPLYSPRPPRLQPHPPRHPLPHLQRTLLSHPPSLARSLARLTFNALTSHARLTPPGKSIFPGASAAPPCPVKPHAQSMPFSRSRRYAGLAPSLCSSREADVIFRFCFLVRSATKSGGLALPRRF